MPLTDRQKPIFDEAINQIKRERGGRLIFLNAIEGRNGIYADNWLYRNKYCFGRFFTSSMSKKIPAPENFYVPPSEDKWLEHPRSYRYCFAVDVVKDTFNIVLMFNFPEKDPNLLSHEADKNRQKVIGNCRFWAGRVYQNYFPLNVSDIKITRENVIKSIADLFVWEETIFPGERLLLPPEGTQTKKKDPDPPLPPPDQIRKQAYDELMRRARDGLLSNPRNSEVLTAEAKRLYPDVHAWYENQKAVKVE